MQDSGDFTLEGLAQTLSGDAAIVHARAILTRSDDKWHLRHVWALVGARPPIWSAQDWQYEKLAFVSAVLTLTDLGALCSKEGDRTIAFGDYVANLPPAQEQVRFQRKPSYSRHDRPMLPWPTVDFMVSTPGQFDRNIGQDFLVSEHAPSFTSPASAYRAFFLDSFALQGQAEPPSELADIRVVNKSAVLGPMHVGPTEIRIEVSGQSVQGTVLELYGRTDRASKILLGPGEQRFPLPDGLPEEAWVWLKKDNRWLDYRSLATAWTSDAQLEQAGVTVDIPVEPDEAVETLIYSGEGPYLEFKSKLPGTADERRHTFKTVSAFANGDGGTIIFGVNRDEMTIDGLGDGDPVGLRDQLTAMVRSRVHPTPDVVVSHHLIDGKLVLALRVEPGSIRPYAISVDESSKDRPEYYVRRGANTYPAQPADLRDAVLPPASASPPSPLFQ